MRKNMKKALAGSISIILLYCGAVHAKDAPESKTVKQRLQIGSGLPDNSVFKTISQKLAASNPELEISICKVKEDEGLALLEKGLLNMLISDTLPERKLAKKFHVFPFAVSAVKIIVSSENPLSDISQEKTAEIFSRAIINWKEAGGPDAPICIYALGRDSETSRTFEALIMEKSSIYDKILSVNSDREITTLTAADRNAIGYSGMTNIKSKYMKTLTLDKVAPSIENILSGKYKCARKIYIITVQETEYVKKFTEALNSPAGNEAVKNSGLIPLAPAKR